MSVRVERSGPVWTIILERPEVRNAVDGPTAAALSAAFREFDADADASVAVLWGAGGRFVRGLIWGRWGLRTGIGLPPTGMGRWDLRGCS